MSWVTLLGIIRYLATLHFACHVSFTFCEVNLEHLVGYAKFSELDSCLPHPSCLQTECWGPLTCMCRNLISAVTVFGRGAFGRCLGPGSGALTDRISAFIQGTPESFPPITWGHGEDGVCEPGSWFSPGTESAGAWLSLSPSPEPRGNRVRCL